MRQAHHDAYTLDEIAAAAGAAPARVAQALRASSIVVTRGFVAGPEAVAVVRELAGIGRRRARSPLTVLPEARRTRAAPLALSAIAHGLIVLALSAAATLGLLKTAAAERPAPAPERARLVFLITPGPGGGGGGGGLKMPAPPRKAAMKARAPKPKRVSSPVPKPARRPVPARPVPARPAAVTPPPPAPIAPAPSVPAPVLPVPPPAPRTPAPTKEIAPVAPAVVAPVLSSAADAHDRAGLPESPGNAQSTGPGSGGGIGSGAGQGLGEGTGGGTGPGFGGGTGGGPYRPGSGITPPQLIREVRANYTDEARRRAIAGDVVLEIVVRRDGNVGQVRVLQSLGAGLEQRAIDAVRQWRFSPAMRQGTAVDVVVEVAVGFSLR